MKKVMTITAMIFAIALLLSGSVLSAMPPDMRETDVRAPGGPAFDARRPPLPPPLPLGIRLLLRAQEVNAIARLTGETPEMVKQHLSCTPGPIFLEENGISPEEFGKAMDEQSLKLVEQAAAGGVITRAQADDIVKKVRRYAKGPDGRGGGR
jgi:hypothetical protein